MNIVKCTLLLFVLAIGVFGGNIHAQNITTIAGMGNIGGLLGEGVPATSASINLPGGGRFDSAGNFYFAIRLQNKVRKVSNTGIITTVVGTGIAGFSGDGGPANLAQINNPLDVAFDSWGNLYVADFYNERIRKVDKVTGVISTYAGNGIAGYGGDGGPAISASLNAPQFICFDRSNNLYISDVFNQRIRKVTPSGIITTVAGNGIHTYTGDGGLADTTSISYPWSVATDTADNLYIADNDNFRVRRVDKITGIITTVVGNGNPWYFGEGLPGTSFQLSPNGLVFDHSNNLYITDNGNERVYKLNAAGIVTTVAGNGTAGFSGDGGLATSAQIWHPQFVTTDVCDNIYISDVQNSRIRKVTFSTTTSSPTIHISAAPGDTVCSGTMVTFNSMAAGGYYTTYQWYVNGTLASSSGPTYTFAPSNGDSVFCIATFSTCNGGIVLNSNVVHMTAIPSIAPDISISVIPNDTVCNPEILEKFTAVVSGGGTSPYYQWMVNGLNAGVNSPLFSYIASSGDSVRCTVLSNAMCAVSYPVSSNTIHMTIIPASAPSISITGSSVAPVGSVVTVSATVAGAGSSYNIRWLNNGVEFALTSIPEATYTKTIDIDLITATILSAYAGCFDSVTSNINIITASNSVLELNGSDKVEVFPNPVSDNLFVTGIHLSSYRILNAVGQLMQRSVFLDNSNAISVRQLPAGCYLLEINEDNGMKSILKFSKL